MANRYASSPGPIREFQGEGELIGPAIGIPGPGTAAASAAERSFLGLSDQLGELADSAAAREGSLAGLQAGQQAGVPSSPTDQPGPAVLPSAGSPGVSGAGVPVAGISAGLVDRVISVESGGDPKAAVRNPDGSIGAVGAAQFEPGTWLDVLKRYKPELAAQKSRDELLALRTDPALSREMAGRYLGEQATALSAAGIPQTPGNIYLGYFLGPAGAVKLLSAGDATPTSQVVDAGSIAGNKSVLEGKTVGQVKAWAAAKMAGAETGPPTAPSGVITRLQAGEADLAGLSPSAHQMLDGIVQSGAVKTLNVTSGARRIVRDPQTGQLVDTNARAGGAKDSQHKIGNAVDISLIGMSDAEKAAVLNAAVANGARGIGIYGGGTKLHVDTRATPTFWGTDPEDAYHGVDPKTAPAWAQPALKMAFAAPEQGGASAQPVANGATQYAPSGGQPGPALALKNNNTIRGNAFDKAAIQTHAWRTETALTTDLGEAWIAHRDDPAALEADFQRIRGTYLEDASLGDPRLKDTFDQAFQQKVAAYRIEAVGRLATQRQAESAAAAGTLIQAQNTDLERQAYIMPDGEAGDRALAGAISGGQAKIDAMVAARAITPEEGQKQKVALAESGVRGRIQGRFDALPSPQAKLDFANALVPQWATGKGPLAGLDFRVVSSVADHLASAARIELTRNNADLAVAKVKLASAVADDVASVAKTGTGVLSNGKPLDAAEVGAILGPGDAVKWQQDRAAALRAFNATHDFPTLSDAELEARVESLKPGPGNSDFKSAEALYELAQRQAQQIVRLRRDDPAKAAGQAFQSVRDAAQVAARDNTPASTQTMIGERLHAQAALAIPALGQEPLTRDEALLLSRQISQASPGPDQVKAMQGLVGNINATYGPFAERVLAQVLAERAIDRDLAVAGAQMLRKLHSGVPPATSQLRGMDIGTETGRAIAATKPPTAVQGAPAAATPAAAAGRQIPNTAQVGRLLQNPQLAPDFDQKFGTGSAAFYLGLQKQEGTVTKGTDGTVTRVMPDGSKYVTHPDGSEDFIP